MNTRNFKHKHGTPNPIIEEEEKTILATVDKALASTQNAQIIGQNGEIPLRQFLKRYLPYTLRAETGHFVTPSGLLSPQIDIMILDARYPLLSENADGSVLAMLHSLIGTVEVKTRISTSNLRKLWNDSATIKLIASEININKSEFFGSLLSYAVAYRCKNRLKTLAERFFEIGD